jgi:mono/diheme cytochrome c family protein
MTSSRPGLAGPALAAVLCAAACLLSTAPTPPALAADGAPAERGPAAGGPADGGPAERGSSAGAALAKRGEYVARAADCTACHSQPHLLFGGGAALDTPFGKIYGPNITPDKATGIGAWTRADFVRAVREGVGRHGQFLYPAMPYTSYTQMTDADVDALWAYLRSVPPLRHTSPENTLPFPLNIRSSMVVWNSLYFKSGRFTPAAAHDAAWNHGSYLVNALGHCAMCHSPRNLAQANEPQHHLTGAQLTGWYAPDISSDPLSDVARMSVAELATFLKTGRLPGNAKAFGPMQEVIHDSLRYLSVADLHDIAVYLKDQPATTPTTVARTTISAAQLAAGKAVYQDRCASCHQADGKGQPGNIPALAGNTAVTAVEPWNVIMAVLYGFKPQGSWGAMASFAGTLNDDQIAAVTNYVRTAWSNAAEPNAVPWTVGTWRQRAFSTAQAGGGSLLCPNLTPEVIDPALHAGAKNLIQAATDRQALDRVVADYTQARPKSSTAEVIEALSAAYCRAVSGAVSTTAAPESATEAATEAQIAAFSQQVAVALSQAKTTASR